MAPKKQEYLSLSDRAIFKVVTKSINKKALNIEILVVGPGSCKSDKCAFEMENGEKKKGIEKKTFIIPHSLDC